MAGPLLPDTPEIDRRYNNLFFHPIVCHVCKWLNNGNTTLCDCGMISYCSPEHKIMDRDQVGQFYGHEEICEVMQKLILNKKIRNYSGQNLAMRIKLRSEGKPRKHLEWYTHHKNYLKVIQKKLSRDLQPHEKRMLLFARSCYVCHKETDLSPCRYCFCVDYCATHSKKTNPHDCEKRQEWLYTEMRTININPIPGWRSVHDFPNKGDVDDMDTFYQKYMLPAENVQWNIPDLVYSDYVSGPLTVYHGLQLVKLFESETSTKSTFVIHIIETTEVEVTNTPSWELFLHLFHKPTKLTVVMVGPKSTTKSKNKCDTLPTCHEKCKLLGHELRIEYQCMLYHEYASSAFYTMPDVLVGFHVKFSAGESWKQFIFSLKTPDCPLILTTKSKVNATRYVKRIQKVLHKSAKPFINRRNIFRACRLHKDYMNHRIFYQNQHIIVYKNLRHLQV